MTLEEIVKAAADSTEKLNLPGLAELLVKYPVYVKGDRSRYKVIGVEVEPDEDNCRAILLEVEEDG